MALSSRPGQQVAEGTDLLPSNPHVLWRTRVRGNLAHSLAVDQHGRIVVASTTAFTELGADGQEEASFELPAAAVTAPVLLSDGTRAVITADASIVTATPLGTMASKQPLDMSVSRHPVLLVPLPDGGMAVGVGQAMRWLTGSGGWRVASPLPGVAVALFERGHGLLAVTQAGDVFEWNGFDLPRRLASLGGTCEGGAALLNADLLAAIVDRRRLVEVQLVSLTRRIRVPEGPLLRSMAPTLTHRGETRVVTADGLLLGHDSAGRETLRVSLLGREEHAQDAGTTASGPLGGVLVLAAENRLLYAFPGRDPAVVGPQGVISIQGAACSDPVAIAIAGRGRVAGACGSGVVWSATDRSAPDKSNPPQSLSTQAD
jgi:hypothetical protein